MSVGVEVVAVALGLSTVTLAFLLRRLSPAKQSPRAHETTSPLEVSKPTTDDSVTVIRNTFAIHSDEEVYEATETASAPGNESEEPEQGGVVNLVEAASRGANPLLELSDLAPETIREHLLHHGLTAITNGGSPLPNESAPVILRAMAFVGGTFFRQVRVSVSDSYAQVEFGVPPNRIPHYQDVVRGKRIVPRERAEREVHRDYKDLVAESARQAINLAFGTVSSLHRVTVSVYQHKTEGQRGRVRRACVLSVTVDRDAWYEIFHRNLSAELALRNFPLRFQYDLDYRLLEVASIWDGPDQADTDLDSLDPRQFEVLVGDLMLAMGYDHVRLTKASHDGGVDIEAINPRPIIGGKVVVQCKRKTSTVAAQTVRELYGVVMSNNAMKGILITTSSFSADARKFAQGKPMDLIMGKQLANLVRQYEVRIRPPLQDI